MKIFDFQWWRCRDGYHLEQKGTQFALAPASERFDRYYPMEIGGLFAIFADSESTPEGMQSFCNRFGLFGGGMPHLAPLGRGKGSELVDLWHHRAMKGAIELQSRGEVTELAKFWNSLDVLPVVRSELRVSDNGGLEMVFAPPALLQAMWLQFAQFACSGSQLLRCERCSTPFVVGSGTGRRTTSKWCSNACKVSAYQERQAQKEAAQ